MKNVRGNCLGVLLGVRPLNLVGRCNYKSTVYDNNFIQTFRKIGLIGMCIWMWN